MIDGVAVSGRVDRVDTDGRRAIVRDYKGRTVHAGARWAEDGKIQAALYALAVREQLGVEIVGALYQPIGTADQRPRGVVRDDVPGRYVNGDVSDAASLDARLEESRAIAAQAAADLRAGRIRPAPTAAPTTAAARTRGSAAPDDRPPSRREQRAAIEARTGSSLLAANAGSGKTAVMVERIAEAVREDGVAGRRDPRADLHREGRGRARRAAAAAPDRARRGRARPRGRRRLDRHDPRLLRAPAALPAARRGPGPALRGARAARRRAARGRRLRARAGGLGARRRRRRDRPRRVLRPRPARARPRRLRDACAPAATPAHG